MRYSSKLLLFGEHTINRGSNALAIPYPAFGGEWAYSDEVALQQNLQALAAYLQTWQQEGKLLAHMDVAAFQQELTQGLYFKSNIPVGYGLGSSGALCAALYDRFCLDKIKHTDNQHFKELKESLAQIESFFHGASSGTDPLICYLNQPIVIKATGDIEMVDLPAHSELTFFLLDTGIPRSTGPLVNYFLKRCEEQDFVQNTLEKLVQYNNKAIDAFLNAKWKHFYDILLEISYIQMNELPNMIPASFHVIWQEGWKDFLYQFKLCGAGGGGFMLGVTFDWKATQEKLSDYNLLKIKW